MIRQIMIVGMGGFVGAVTRFTLSGLIHRYYKGAFPAGTLVVNIVGCFVIGGLMYFVEDRQLFSPSVRLFSIIGILGAFTTFSTFGYETFEMIKEWNIHFALLNTIANVLLGIVAIVIGRAFAGLLGI